MQNDRKHFIFNQFRSKGFTLIELMIVVAIIGILAAIALPSYRDYVLRGYLVDATSALSATRAQMEQYFQDNRTYVAVAGFPSPCANTFTAGKFSVACSNVTAVSYTVTATGTGPAAGFTFTINQTNAQATTASPWSTGACWITRKGGTC
ncbi:MAG: type IV pilin protein [Candidatus Methylopumilus sp.]|jgi:type IV pilus assembly protein PilE